MKGSEAKNQPAVAVPYNLPLIVTAAHELKAPLALIRQLSLALEDEKLSQAERERLGRQIVLVSERALRLTTDLSRSSRLEDSLFELEPINPIQLCEEVAHELTPLYTAKGREIRVASRYRPLLAVANKDLLRRIMLQFGDNALHHAEAELPVELHANLFGANSAIRLAVRDFGPAVPAALWQQLKTTIGTSAQALPTRPQSSGLGLYVAGQFAAAMQGTIGAVRHRNGATFYVDVTASRQLSLL